MVLKATSKRFLFTALALESLWAAEVTASTEETSLRGKAGETLKNHRQRSLSTQEGTIHTTTLSNFVDGACSSNSSSSDFGCAFQEGGEYVGNPSHTVTCYDIQDVVIPEVHDDIFVDVSQFDFWLGHDDGTWTIPKNLAVVIGTPPLHGDDNAFFHKEAIESGKYQAGFNSYTLSKPVSLLSPTFCIGLYSGPDRNDYYEVKVATGASGTGSLIRAPTCGIDQFQTFSSVFNQAGQWCFRATVRYGARGDIPSPTSAPTTSSPTAKPTPAPSTASPSTNAPPPQAPASVTTASPTQAPVAPMPTSFPTDSPGTTDAPTTSPTTAWPSSICGIPRSSVLVPNQILSAGGAGLFSPNLQYYLAMSAAGNLQLLNVTAGELIYASKTKGNYPEALLRMQPDGNLVIYRDPSDTHNPGNALWATDTHVDIRNGDVAALTNEGDLRVYEQQVDEHCPYVWSSLERDNVWPCYCPNYP